VHSFSACKNTMVGRSRGPRARRARARRPRSWTTLTPSLPSLSLIRSNAKAQGHQVEQADLSRDRARQMMCIRVPYFPPLSNHQPHHSPCCASCFLSFLLFHFVFAFCSFSCFPCCAGGLKRTIWTFLDPVSFCSS
jgi:hypothetical protein